MRSPRERLGNGVLPPLQRGETANLLDIDPGVDRAHFALVTPGGRQPLRPFEWRLFEALYQRHGRIVSVGELATAVGFAEARVRAGVYRLHYLLTGSRFQITIHRSYGYELIVRDARRT